MTTLTEKDKELLALELKLQAAQKWTNFGVMLLLVVVLSVYGFISNNLKVHFINIPLVLVITLSLLSAEKFKKNILEAIVRNTKEMIKGTITKKVSFGKKPSFYFTLDNNEQIHLETANAFKLYKKFEIGDRIEIERLPVVGIIIDITKK